MDFQEVEWLCLDLDLYCLIILIDHRPNKDPFLVVFTFSTDGQKESKQIHK